MQKIDSKTGVDLSAVTYSVIDTYLGKLGLPTDGAEYTRLVRLHDAMQCVPNRGTKLGNCSTCRGKSHVDLTCCPFCGDGDVDESVKQARSETVDDPEHAALLEIRKVLEQRKVEEDEKRVKEQVRAKPPKKEGESAPPADLVQVKPGEGVRGRRSKGKGEQITMPAGDKVATTSDLDASVEQIKGLLTKAVETIYDAAVVISDVYERKLWMQRRDSTNAPLYRSFTEWVTAELPISPQYAHEIKDLPLHFTRQQVQQFGSTKLTLSLRISEEERRRLIESGRLESMTVRETKQQITQAPATEPKGENRSTLNAGHQNRPGRKPTQREAAKEKGAKAGAQMPSVGGEEPAISKRPRIAPEPLQVVTAVLPSRVEIELMARSKGRNAPGRARSLADDPSAVFTCANGARMRFTLFTTQEGYVNAIVQVESPANSKDDDTGEE